MAGSWRSHAGDDPRDPAFDDSAWKLVRPERFWPVLEEAPIQQKGFSWYRLQLQVPASDLPLALLIPALQDSYQIFMNGTRIGQVGGMPPHAEFVVAYNQVFSIPARLVRLGEPNVLAFRVWVGPRMAPFYLKEPGPFAPYIGEANAIQKMRSLLEATLFRSTEIDQVSAGVDLLAALLGYGLFLTTPRDREYLWFAIAQTFLLVHMVGLLGLDFGPFDYKAGDLMFRVGVYAAWLSLLEFFLFLSRQRRDLLYWIAAIPITVGIFGQIVMASSGRNTPEGDWLGPVCNLCFAIAVFGILLRATRAGSLEARILIVPYSFNAISSVMEGVVLTFGWAKAPVIGDLYRLWLLPITKPFPIYGPLILGLICVGSVCIVLIWRFGRTRQDEERLHTEFEAARVLQHALIPDELPEVVGAKIEAVYKPAGQVGGDFFQVIPHSEGSTLIAIGDVSGKGMQAAMSVAVLVGALRTVVEYTPEPADILAALNQRMASRSQGGFTTCLVLRIDADRTVTCANAGHVPPYLNGKELELENGLPLGIVASAEYSQQTIQLYSQDRLTLVTDGIVEAKNGRGELFGFDRTAQLSVQSAERIAVAAQSFGQEDDITVLSIILDSSKANTMRTAAGEL